MGSKTTENKEKRTFRGLWPRWLFNLCKFDFGRVNSVQENSNYIHSCWIHFLLNNYIHTCISQPTVQFIILLNGKHLHIMKCINNSTLHDLRKMNAAFISTWNIIQCEACTQTQVPIQIWRVSSQSGLTPVWSIWDIWDLSCWNTKNIIRKFVILLIIT